MLYVFRVFGKYSVVAHFPRLAHVGSPQNGGQLNTCVSVTPVFAEEKEPLWLTALLLMVPEAFGFYVSLHSAKSEPASCLTALARTSHKECGL